LIDANRREAKTPARPLAFHAGFWTIVAPASFWVLVRDGELARYGITALVASSLVLLPLLGWIGTLVSKRNAVAGILTALTGWYIFYAASISALPSFAIDQSAHFLAAAAETAAGTDGEVVCYHTYLQGFPWELRRRVKIYGWKGELDFGSSRGDQAAWFPPREAFWKEWDSPKKMVALLRKKDRPDMEGHRAELVAQNRKYFVVKNF
jgi:hypothetical protein